MVRPSTKPSHRDLDSSSSDGDSYATFSTSSGIEDASTTRTPNNVARRGSRTSTIRRGGSGSTRLTSATPPPPVVVRSPQTAKRGRSFRGRVPTPHPVPSRTAPPSPPKVPSSTQTRRKESSNRDRGNKQVQTAKQPANTTTAEKKSKKKYRPAVGVLAQIRFFQVDTTDNLIPKLPFQRLVREITQNFGYDMRYTKVSIEALQTAAEAYIVGILEDSDLIAKHSKRVTLMDRDMKLAYRIRGDK